MDSVVIAAGGTGGHVYPALAVAAELAGMSPGVPITFAGTSGGLESRVVPGAGYPFEAVRTAPWRRGRPWTIFSAAALAALGSMEARRMLARRRAGVVFSTGGYAAAPVLLAAFLARIPIVLHEPNARPGVVTRLFGRAAAQVTTGAEEAAQAFPPGRVRVTGVPVRRSVLAVPREEARRKLGLGEGFTVLVLGGSQGASALNAALEGAIPALGEAGIPLALVWLCGKRDFERSSAAARAARLAVKVFAYLDDMGSALGAADLVVARAGAGTVAELLAAGLPSILVPYPYAAADHQARNASVLAGRGAARVMPETELSPAALAGAISALARDGSSLAAMAESARALSRPDAASVVAGEILAVLTGVGPSTRPRDSLGAKGAAC